MGRPAGSKNRVMTLESLKSMAVESKSLEQAKIEKDLSKETDESITARLGQRFEILEDMTRAVKKGCSCYDCHWSSRRWQELWC